MTNRTERRSGLTLIGLLIAIGMISILIRLILPSVQGVQEAARRARVNAEAQTDDDSAPVYEFVLSGDETRMFCRSSRKQIAVRDTRSGSTIAVMEFRGKTPMSITASTRGDLLLAGYRDGTLVLWSESAKNGGYRPKVLAHDSSVTVCAISPTGRLVAAGHRDGLITLWDARRGSLLRRLPAHSGEVHCVGFDRDGLRVLSADDRSICVWDVQNGKLHARLSGHRTGRCTAEFSPDGRHVVAGSRADGTLRYWNLSSATEVWSVQAAKLAVTTIACSSDGRTVASIDEVGNVCVREAVSGRRITTIPTTGRLASCVRFSSDGRKIYVGKHDGTIGLWTIAASAPVVAARSQ